jgi:hypothetical protein
MATGPWVYHNPRGDGERVYCARDAGGSTEWNKPTFAPTQQAAPIPPEGRAREVPQVRAEESNTDTVAHIDKDGRIVYSQNILYPGVPQFRGDMTPEERIALYDSTFENIALAVEASKRKQPQRKKEQE